MQKIPSALLFLLSSIIIFSSCNSGAGGEAYTIKRRMNEGDSFHHNMKMNMVLNMTVMGNTMDMKTNMDVATSFKVLSSTSPDKELKMTYNDMHMTMDMGKLNSGVNMDSILNNSYSHIKGKSVLFTLSPKNEITDVKGFDSLMIREDDDPAQKEMLEKMFSKEQMNSLFGMMFSMYPEKPVHIGESWTASTLVSVSNIEMKVNITYKLIGVKNGLADIDVEGKLDGKGKMAQGGANMELSMTGTQKGMITIKLEDGNLENGSYKMSAKAEMDMMGQKVPMNLTAEYFLNGK